jgi:hypothetical protein
MNRFDWLAQFFRPAPRPRKPRFTREKKPVPAWKVCVPGCKPLTAKAHTKGEARAFAKRELGFKGRLPVGSLVVRKGKA